MVRLGMACPSNMAIFPVQDILGLDASARMNTPGSSSGNWEWRLKENMLTGALAKHLAKITDEFERSKAQ